MTRAFDLSLYLVTDRNLSRGRSLHDVIMAAVKGGVTIVQLREKDLSTDQFVKDAKEIKSALTQFDIPLIINDRVDVALAAGADGVHLGQDDMHPEDARRVLGRDVIIGLSVGNISEMQRFDPAFVDYVGIGPAFITQTKVDAGTALGTEGVRNLRRQISVPCVGIGGINNSNAASILQSGVDGIAVVSAICSADNPEHAARDLKSITSAIQK